ncbi:MAG: hydrogenase nickel incorporation protein HypB [Agathobacter sp.]|nr:hydrogenase nickel incorporation protein HypB [Agathobacter sp.]
MNRVEILDVKKTILEDNNADADLLREQLKEDGIFYVNVMSSPGAGKTTTLLATIKRLKDRYSIGVMEADIDSDVDALAIADAGVKAIQLHTGGMCHLDAEMSRQGMFALGTENLELVILENVGNLVCPAEFDTGAVINVAILSAPEGHDKPLKYPLMFELCDTVLINKIDAMPAFDFDMEEAKRVILQRNPKAMIFPVSAKTGEGIDAWCEWLSQQIAAFGVKEA